MVKYNWALKSLAKNIDPLEAIQELQRIESLYGSLTPENLVSAASDVRSLFHPIFDWNDISAAHKYRLQQARTLINNIEVSVISDGQEKSLPVFEIVRRESGNAYRRIDTFSHDEKEQVKQRIINSLNSYKSLLSIYNGFDFVLLKLNETIEAISNA